MRTYAIETMTLSSQVFEAIIQSLSLSSTFWQNKLEQGMQMIGINCYESASKLNGIKIGQAQHSDHTIITLLAQSRPGLQVMSPMDGAWKAVPTGQRFLACPCRGSSSSP